MSLVVKSSVRNQKILFSPDIVDAWIREQELQGYYDMPAQVNKENE